MQCWQKPFSKTEMKTTIKNKLKERWQKLEEERTGGWRKAGMMRSKGRTWREETIISRLHAGHTRLNCKNILQEGVNFVIRKKRHVMFYCPKYDAERRELILNLKKNKVKFWFSYLIFYKEALEILKLCLEFVSLDSWSTLGVWFGRLSF